MRVSRSVLSDSLRPRGLWPARLLCPWDSPGQSAAVGPSRFPGHLPHPGMELVSPALAGGFFTAGASREARWDDTSAVSVRLRGFVPAALLPCCHVSQGAGADTDRPRVVPAAHPVHWAPVSFPLDISRICPLASRGFGPVFPSPGPWQRLLLSALRFPFAAEPCSPSAFPALSSCGSA